MHGLLILLFGGFLRFLSAGATLSAVRGLLGPALLPVAAFSLALPCIAGRDPGPLAGGQLFIFALRQAVQGFLTALPFEFAFLGIVSGFRLIDVARGAQFAEQMIPSLERRVSQLEEAAVLFLLCAVMPIEHSGAFISLLYLEPSAQSSSVSLLSNIHELYAFSAHCFLASVCLAAPVLIVLFALEVGLALCSALVRPSALSNELSSAKVALSLLLILGMLQQGVPQVQARRLGRQALAISQEQTPKRVGG